MQQIVSYEETIRTFFITLGLNREKIDQLVPTYTMSLFRDGEDHRMMIETIVSLVDTWTSPYHPTVAEIRQQYKIKKSREANIRAMTQRKIEADATTTAESFWKCFKKAKSEGKSINEIAHELQKVCVSKKKSVEKRCKHNFCDGKKYIIATRRDRVLKAECEALFRCKCSEELKGIPLWDNQKGFKIKSGLCSQLMDKIARGESVGY